MIHQDESKNHKKDNKMNEKTYYMTIESGSQAGMGAGSNHGALSETPPAPLVCNIPYTTFQFGWQYNYQSNAKWCQMRFHKKTPIEFLLEPMWKTAPDNTTVDNWRANCWVIGPLNGTFDAGDWVIKETAKLSFEIPFPTTVKFYNKLFKASDALGTNAVELHSGFGISQALPLTLVGVGQPNAQKTGETVISLPTITFNNEWLFIQPQLNRVIGTTQNTTVVFVLGPDSGSIVTPPFN